MATIQRPLKLYGTRKYVDEVAADTDHKAPILSAEVDADLDGIYAAWNGGVDAVNIKPGVITTGHLADGSVTDIKIGSLSWDKVTGKPTYYPIQPGTIGTAEIADGTVTGAKIADGSIGVNDIADGNVTRAKIQVNACNGNVATYAPAAGFVLSTPNVWTNFGSGQYLTTRGGWVHLFANPGMSVWAQANAAACWVRWLRNGAQIVSCPWTTVSPNTYIPIPGLNWIDFNAPAQTNFYQYQVMAGNYCIIVCPNGGQMMFAEVG